MFFFCLPADAELFIEQPDHCQRSAASSLLLRRRIRSVVILSVDVGVDEDVRRIRPDDGSVVRLVVDVFEPRRVRWIFRRHERKFKVKKDNFLETVKI